MLGLSTMAKRSYRQNCALARTSDAIGQRWTLLLIRDLLIAPRRFNDLLASEQGMGTNLLAARLKELESAGLVRKVNAGGGAQAYSLTERGQALEPAILALIRWGLTHGPAGSAEDRQENDWDLLALKAAFQPARAKDLSITVQFECHDFAGWVRIENQKMQIGLGPIDEPDVVVKGSVSDLFLGAKSPQELLESGDTRTLSRFMRAFALRA